ncbi:amidohydrolase family protein [Bosea sp. BK604]|uniref:amidohydrolase family protein n=1 Tax=Bosea sp. BK604 TaxID=2512180 RepID=UPI0010EBED1E|nr:amidohydrolase family protein [Bosea sp. BK604]TCR70445.1 cytosine/adenosine deaminase-related metal-dependent hydrolase [Bosea sp. BK604]
MKKLIKGGRVVSMDAAIGDFVRGDVLIEDDRIVAVAAHIEADADEVHDATDMIVLPGLVNAHLHTWQTGLRSIGAGWTGPDYHRLMHGNMGTRFNAEDNYVATLVGALEQLNGGVTTLFDWCHNLTSLEMAERSVDGLEESGIRAVFGHGTAKPLAADGDLPFTHRPHARERLEALRKGRFASDDRRVTLAAAILGPQFSTPEVTEHDFRMARDLGLLSSSHAARRPQDRVSAKGYFIPAERGLLDHSHNVVHGNYLTDEELKLVVESGASITVTSLIELHVHPADPVTGRVSALGGLPSLGVDSIPAANSDLFTEMRVAMLFQRALEHRANYRKGNGPLETLPVRSREALEWITIGGARALGLEHLIGSLTPGKKADIILIGMKALNLFPVHDPVHTVVQQANAFNVDTVFVNGDLIKRNGSLLFDANTLRKRQAELEISAARIIRESGYQLAAA